ncbi:MAG: hypothetical protein HFF19_02155, partial [Oscillospiraceae bacterium]|nr:hypothetical protein [Oscillospiraceae bacterium]
MVTNNDIADAIADLVEKAFPGEKLYRDYTPTGFERPSNLLALSEGGKFFPNASCGGVELRPKFTLTTFVPVDANPKAMRDEWSGDIGCGVKY